MVATERPRDGVTDDATETHRELQYCWNGYCISDANRSDMTAELFISTEGRIYGGGSDEVGDFTWSGRRRGTRVDMVKQYICRHKVDYNGEINGTTITGTWSIGGGYYGRGTFHLNRTDYHIDLGEIRRWTGYYMQGTRRDTMNTDLIFTDARHIYGNGRDDVGRYTWLGRYASTDESKLAVHMTKQYEGQQYAVYYSGAVVRQGSKVVMEGPWVLSTQVTRNDEGPWRLEFQETNRVPRFTLL